MGCGIVNFFEIMSGAVMVAAWVAGLFFFKFWSRTKERLFLWFGISFVAMGFERLLIGFLHNTRHEDFAFLYLIRLLAFSVIVLAILDTNRRGRNPK